MAIKDLVTTALADNIDKMRTEFGTEIGGRLAEKMGERKAEIAKAYFGQAVAEPKAE